MFHAVGSPYMFKSVQSLFSDHRIVALDIDLNAITLIFVALLNHGRAMTKRIAELQVITKCFYRAVRSMDTRELASS